MITNLFIVLSLIIIVVWLAKMGNSQLGIRDRLTKLESAEFALELSKRAPQITEVKRSLDNV